MISLLFTYFHFSNSVYFNTALFNGGNFIVHLHINRNYTFPVLLYPINSHYYSSAIFLICSKNNFILSLIRDFSLYQNDYNYQLRRFSRFFRHYKCRKIDLQKSSVSRYYQEEVKS